MKHRLPCLECLKTDKASTIFAVGEIESTLVAICTCPKGHVVVSGLMHDHFDVLYTSAVHAFMNSFYSESVMSFTSSLERSYEQYIKLFLLKEGVSLNLVDSYWNELNNQSERQYGAFCSAYVSTEKKVWQADQDQVKFRNNVVHKGHIASNSEARSYGEYVTARLNLVMNSMKVHFKDQKLNLYFHIKHVSSTEVKKVMSRYTSAIYVATHENSLLRWDTAEHLDATLSDAIAIAERLMHI